ncbi:Acylphosphatase [Desulfovibrionales bacterium]
MIRSLQCIISGKVQGVYFRSWSHSQATSMGIKGWVRNIADGKVEILAQGLKTTLKEFIAHLLRGSPLSKVENIECKWTDYDKEYINFEIRN